MISETINYSSNFRDVVLVVRNLRLPGVKAIPFEPAIAFPSYVLHAQQRPEPAMAKVFLDCLREIAASQR